MFRNFPGGPVVKKPPPNAQDMGSVPFWGTKIPRAVGQLRPPPCFRAHALQLEKAPMMQRRPSTAKIKNM